MRDTGEGETRGDLRGQRATAGMRESRSRRALPLRRGSSAARPLAGPLVPGLGGAPGKHVQPPARRPRPWTRACRPLRGCSGGQREAPGPRGYGPGPEPVSPPPHAAVRQRPGRSPQSRPSAAVSGGLAPRRPLLGPAPQPRSRPLSSRRPARAAPRLLLW